MAKTSRPVPLEVGASRKRTLRQLLVAGGGTVVSVVQPLTSHAVVVGTGVVVHIAYRVSRFMSSLNFMHVSSFGFYVGGVATGVLMVSLGLFSR